MTLGHTKGVVVFDKDNGFWMVHSVPKFPPAPGKLYKHSVILTNSTFKIFYIADSGKYDYPTTGEKYGQSFLCISLKTSESADKVGNQVEVKIFWKIRLFW